MSSLSVARTTGRLSARLLTAGLLTAGLLTAGLLAAVTPGSPPAPDPAARWTLVWSDEFSGPAGRQPDERFWNYDLGNRDTNGWGNQELEFYTRDPQNVRLDGRGHLDIRALKSGAAKAGATLPCWNGQPCPYTSARLTTAGKVTFTYGKVEARLRVPAGRGFWPAFWSLGQTGRWPENGEIDVMEWLGREPDTVYGTLHGPGYSGEHGLGGQRRLPRAASDGFHTYALIKRPQELVWLLDGVPYHRVTPQDRPAGQPWVFDGPFYLLLNLAVGGQWPGSPDADTVFPGTMTVDYVRVWREEIR